MSEDNTNMFGETISEEDSQIIDFINERELYYETMARNEIMLEVEKKFGNKGKEVLSQLNEDVSVLPENLECPECGKISKEVMDSAEQQLKLIEVAFDSEFDAVVKYVMFHNNETLHISLDLVKEAIERFSSYKLGEIPYDVMQKVKIKILFDGIQEGWLIDEIFE